MSTIPPVTDPRFDPDYGQPAETKKKRNPWATCLIGCLIVILIMVVLGVLAAIWVARNFRGLAADVGSSVAKNIIDQSALPQQEKADINIQIDRLATAVRENRISMEQGQRLVDNLVNSPLMTSFMVSAIEKSYFAKSGLSEEEKTEGRITLQRFISGMINKSIGEQAIDNAMQHVATKDANGHWNIRQRLTDADLRAFLAAAKQAADDAGVPEKPPAFDPSDEFKRIVDEALAQPGAAAEAPMPNESAEPKAAE
jgi:hypothetical protein